MTALSILLDTDRFPLPSQNNRVLDAFLSTKKEIERSLKTIEAKIATTGCIIILSFRPDKTDIDYIIEDANLKNEIIILLSKTLDLSKISTQIFSTEQN